MKAPESIIPTSLLKALLQALRKSDMTYIQYLTLRLCHETYLEGVPMRTGRITRILEHTGANTTLMLDAMVKHGWVDRRPLATDRRVTLIVPSEEGKILLKGVEVCLEAVTSNRNAQDHTRP